MRPPCDLSKLPWRQAPSDPIRIGDDVVIGEQLDPKDSFLYKGYFGRVMDLAEGAEKDGYAFVDSDEVGFMQSVSFKAWIPIRTLTRTA